MGRTLTDMEELERLKKQREARKGKS